MTILTDKHIKITISIFPGRKFNPPTQNRINFGSFFSRLWEQYSEAISHKWTNLEPVYTPPHSDSLTTSILAISEYWSTYNVNLSLHFNKGNAWVTETFLLIYFQLLGKIFRVNVALCYNPNVNRFLFFIINRELCDIQIRPLISCLTVVTSCLSDTVIPQNWTLH